MERLKEWRKLIGLVEPERDVDVIDAFTWNAILNKLQVSRKDWRIPKNTKKAIYEHFKESDFDGEVVLTRKSFDGYHDSEILETSCGIILLEDDRVRVAGSREWTDKVSLKVEELLKGHTKNDVYVLSNEHGELSITELPTLVCESLISDNYTEETCLDFEHIANDLAAPQPCGRLVLLHGLPGTGKTFFIRGLVEQLNDKVYPIIVPPALTAKITEPSMVDTFMEKAGRKPLVLIAEDADTMLLPRETDNIAEVSTLLNLTDGLIGQSLDIRVVLTTNAGVFKLDKALTRPGRLCRAIEFPLLRLNHARKIAKRIGKTLKETDEHNKCRSNVSLAEIYCEK